MKKETFKVFDYTAATIAYLIGSGLASGQEIVQFFSSYGLVKSCLAALIMLLIFCCVTVATIETGRKKRISEANNIYKVYCGKYLGTFFAWLTPLILFSIYAVMISGAGTLSAEYFSVPNRIGRLIMLILSLGTVLSGFEKLVSVIAKIGHVIILIIIVLSICSIVKITDWSGASSAAIAEYGFKRASPSWLLSGINYASFCALTLYPFLAELGNKMNSKKEAVATGLFSSFVFFTIAMLINFSLLGNISALAGKEMPAVFIANLLFPRIGGIGYSVILYSSIYTTAVPMLWTTCNRIAVDDKSLQFKFCAVVLAVSAYFIGGLPFSVLINFIYPYIGYVGIFVFACLIITMLKQREF
ncbi:hypothetical protein HRI96_06445 [Treponema parvum]|uniref:Uncharacterized protein n=1 Tax=Treponema parvum TaxID=138851 RepID=A0A975F411_9SPIR|nr:hypothetical protein [Treponema parvum]QTQ11869.1 hypothetical protein HRI96_06445 [Treponema parvum]QTQ13943.1 hypothetical protein HRQ91_05445 [Treponema parvum]